MGVVYIVISLYFSTKFYEETTQKLNANVANHLIDEKFQDASPFLENGDVNKPLFGDIMHDMMAVNRGIEVYLLNMEGKILYSVVLEDSGANEPARNVNLLPIKKFISQNGNIHILGDDPRNPLEQKIFSAAYYKKDGHEGYVYIVLASEAYQNVSDSLASSYFMKLGVGALLIHWLA